MSKIKGDEPSPNKPVASTAAVDTKEAAAAVPPAAKDEPVWAMLLRAKLKEHPAYLVGARHENAAKKLIEEGKRKVFMLRASGFNPDVPGKPDKLAWQHTHMIFGISEIDADNRVQNHRYIIGKDFRVTAVQVPVDKWKQVPGTIPEKPITYRNVDDLVQHWMGKGYQAVVEKQHAAKQERIAGQPENMYQALPLNNYVSFKAAFMEQRKKISENSNLSSGAAAPAVIFDFKSTQEALRELSASEIENNRDKYLCPITCDYMHDPVYIEEDRNHAFERKNIEEWFNTNNTNPLTNEKVKSKTLIPADKKFKEEMVTFQKKYDPKSLKPAAPGPN